MRCPSRLGVACFASADGAFLAPSTRTTWLGVGRFARRAAEHAGAVLVGAFVASDVLRALLVTLAEYGFDLGDRELVIPGPRLLLAAAR